MERAARGLSARPFTKCRPSSANETQTAMREKHVATAMGRAGRHRLVPARPPTRHCCTRAKQRHKAAAREKQVASGMKRAGRVGRRSPGSLPLRIAKDPGAAAREKHVARVMGRAWQASSGKRTRPLLIAVGVGNVGSASAGRYKHIGSTAYVQKRSPS